MVIKLSPVEVEIARFIGRRRNRLSLETKQNARRDPAQTDAEMNIQAIGAELAVAKYLNVYPDLSPTAGKLPEFDLLWNKRMVEVKRNHELQGDLLVPKLNETVLYVLACGELPQYVGEWVELKYGACWRVHPAFLNSPGEKEEND